MPVSWHGLEFEDRGECALRDLGLVRRVRRQKLAARHHGIHKNRAEMVIHACAQKGREAVAVLRGAVAEVLNDLVFGDPSCQL
jgi:hypothetical protein